MERKNYLFYDLETNGLDYFTTGIMQLSLIDNNQNILINQYTYPFDNRIACSEIHGIDEIKLKENNAISTIDLCLLLKKVIREKYDRNNIYFVAYNNFGYDQIILENNFKICKLKMPHNWYFTDMFPIMKELYPDLKPNFKLKTVFEKICGIDKTIQFHCSLDDTICLFRIFKFVENEYTLFEKYTRPLLQDQSIFIASITSINGYRRSMNLEEKGIKTIGNLYDIFKNHEYNINDLETILRTKYNIYGNYYLANILKNIEVIHYFHLSK